MCRLNVLSKFLLSTLGFLLYVSFQLPRSKIISLKKNNSKTHAGIFSTKGNSKVVGGNQYNIDTTKILSNVHGSGNIDPDFVWKKYGREKFDWTLIVNAWLCVRRKNHNETRLVVYSGDKVQVNKVSLQIYSFQM